jgi:hypothetical protein
LSVEIDGCTPLDRPGAMVTARVVLARDRDVAGDRDRVHRHAEQAAHDKRLLDLRVEETGAEAEAGVEDPARSDGVEGGAGVRLEGPGGEARGR